MRYIFCCNFLKLNVTLGLSLALDIYDSVLLNLEATEVLLTVCSLSIHHVVFYVFGNLIHLLIRPN
jgi:hypothetical protein